MSGRKSLFIFLMGLAWKCRFTMPLLLSGSAAVLGRAWMFQIRVHTVNQLRERERAAERRRLLAGPPLEVAVPRPQIAPAQENELATYDEALEDESWETESTDSWETIVEEVAYG